MAVMFFLPANQTTSNSQEVKDSGKAETEIKQDRGKGNGGDQK